MKFLLRSLGAVVLLGCAVAVGYHFGTGSRNGGAKGSFHSAASADAKPKQRPLEARLPQVVPGESEYQRQEKLFSFARTLSPSDIPAALHDALYLPVAQRNLALKVLLGRWAEIDPAGAMNYTMEVPASAKPDQLRSTALATWAAKDFDSALAWTLSQKPGYLRDSCLTTLACSLVEIDAQRALDFVRTHADPGQSVGAYLSLYAAWAERDYPAALAAADSAELHLRARLLSTVLEKQAEKEPREVLATFMKYKQFLLSTLAMDRALEAWLKRDPTSARNWALNLERGKLRYSALCATVVDGAQKDPDETLTWASQNLADKEREMAFAFTFSRAARSDVEAALKKALALPYGVDRNVSLEEIAKTIAAANPARALQIANELPEGDARTEAIGQICEQWSQYDPKAAVQWAFDHFPSEAADVLNDIMLGWGGADASGALRWLDSLPAGARRDVLIGQTLRNLMDADRKAALTEFAKLQPDSQRAGAEWFTARWALSDPDAAVKWTTILTDDGVRANAIKGVISSWGSWHTEDAANWVNELPAGPDRDIAAQSFAITVVGKDPHGAIEWASSIADELRRETALRQVVRSWIERDKVAAIDWLANDSSLPEGLRAEFQRTAAVAQ